MTAIRVRDRLPFVSVELTFRGRVLTLEEVLLDTGSASSVVAADRVLDIGMAMELDDPLHRLRGVGGVEAVFAKRIDRLRVGGLSLAGFEVEIGELAYGFPLDGILGFDFLTATGAVVDLQRYEIRRA